MKKRFLNFGLLLALGLTTALFNSCGRDDDNNGDTIDNASKITATNVNNGSTQIKTVKAIVFWESGNNYESEAIAQAPYQNNGFTLELPATLQDKYLETIDTDDLEGIFVSDKNFKSCFLEDLRGYNGDDNEIGYFYLEEDNENWEHYTSWIYVDRNVTIKGEVVDDEEQGNFDLTLKKGWNIVYESYIEMENGIVMDSFTISSKKPSGVYFTWNFMMIMTVVQQALHQNLLKTQNRSFKIERKQKEIILCCRQFCRQYCEKRRSREPKVEANLILKK